MYEYGVCPSSSDSSVKDITYQSLSRVSDILNYYYGYYGRPLTFSCTYTTSGSTYSTFERLVLWNGPTSITFYENTLFRTSTAYNGVNVPLRIYGVKGAIN